MDRRSLSVCARRSGSRCALRYQRTRPGSIAVTSTGDAARQLERQTGRPAPRSFRWILHQAADHIDRGEAASRNQPGATGIPWRNGQAKRI
jgi:hypothetical protein